MTDAQTEARAIAQRLMLPDEDVFELAVDIIATALAAKEAELVEKNRLLEIALRETAPARDAAIARAERAEAQLAEANKALEGLPFVVQYRRKDGGAQWVDMAAFDVEGAAERYCQSCSGEKSPWEYRFIRRALEARGGE